MVHVCNAVTSAPLGLHNGFIGFNPLNLEETKQNIRIRKNTVAAVGFSDPPEMAKPTAKRQHKSDSNSLVL